MKRLIPSLCVVGIVMALYACGDDTATNSSGGGAAYVLQYPDEAYAMALVEARTLRAPQELVEQIDRELAMIRNEYGEKIPSVLNSRFWSPWNFRGFSITVKVDTAVFSRSDSVGYRVLDSVAQANGASLKEVYYLWPGYNVVPNEPWYPAAAVDIFAGLPGVEWVGTGSTPVAYRYYSTLRVPDQQGAEWFFMEFCEGSYELDLHQFRVVGRKAWHLDSFEPCVDIDTLWGRGYDVFEFARQYADSVNADRPSWVDSAMQVLERLEICHLRAWPGNYPTGCDD